uniref:Uncharacterized protein n=1 Tax=Arion vulgaris TaxID=1028688 RepID=A0A0B7APX9_9EUPU
MLYQIPQNQQLSQLFTNTRLTPSNEETNEILKSSACKYFSTVHCTSRAECLRGRKRSVFNQ